MADRTVSLRITADIQDLQGKLRKAEKDMQMMAGSFSRSLEKNRAEWDQVSNRVGLLGGGLVGLSALAVKSFAGFDKSLSRIKAQGGEAAARIGELRDAAVMAGADTQYSASEAADAITDLAKAGLSVSDILGGGLAGSLALAAAGEMDVKQAAETTATALAQFKLEGSDAGHVADLLAAGANKAMGEVSDLAQALAQGGLVANQTGLSIEETTGALAAFAQQGLMGSDAGTSLKTMLQRLTPQSAEAQKMMDRLGVSAYDSQGQFVGLSKFAGQLQDKMAGLTPQARNAAMGVMFGSDAVRAANVLYAEGAAGIDKWVASVNDQGFAARQAAVLTDNLSGDLERLTGSMDTVAIQSGSGLNDFLRGATQNATGLVNAVGNIPGPLLSSATSMAALTGAAALGTAGFIKGVSALSDYRSSLAEIRKTAPATGRAIDGVTKAAKAAAIGIAAIQIVAAFGQMAQEQIDKTAASVGDAAEALSLMSAESGTGVSGLAKLDAQFSSIQNKLFWWQTGGQAVSGIADAMKKASEASTGFSGGMTALNNTISSFFGNKTVFVEVTEQIAKTDQALASMDGTQAAVAFRQIADAAVQQGLGMDQLLGYFPQYKATLQDTRAQLGAGELSAQDYVDWMGGRIPTAVRDAAAAHPELVSKMNDTQQATLGTTASVEDYVKQLFTAANANLALSGSTIGYKAMLLDTADATKKLIKETKNKKDLTDLDTRAGQAAQANLDKIAATTTTHVGRLIQQGKSQKEVNKAMEVGRKALVDQATAMGFTEEQIADMIAEYAMVPTSVETDMTVTGTGLASTQLSTLKESIKGLPKKTQADVLAKFNKGGIDSAYEALHGINGERAEAWIESLLNRKGIQEWEKAPLGNKYPEIRPRLTKSTFTVSLQASWLGGSPAGSVRKAATGGPVWGAGTETSDSIPAMLSNNEHVWTAAEVRGAGGHGGVERLRALALAGDLPRFAKGGAAKKKAAANAAARAELLAELQTSVRRGTITADMLGGSGLSVVDKLLDWAANAALSKATRSKLSQAAAGYEASLSALTSQLETAKTTLDRVKGVYDDVYSTLSRSGSKLSDLSATTTSTTMHSDASGNIWYSTETSTPTAANIASKKLGESGRMAVLGGKIDQLRKMGANTAFLQELAGLADSPQGVEEAIRNADLFLADGSSIATMNSAYDELSRYSAGAAQFVTESAYAGGLSAAQGVVDTLNSSLSALGEQMAASFATALGQVVVGTTVTDAPVTKKATKKKALGGPVAAGELYQVNEAGVEMFRPYVSGVILTASQTQQAIGSGGPVTAYLTDAQMQQLTTAVVAAASKITTMAAADQAARLPYATGGW